jgi:hypothetical protein
MELYRPIHLLVLAFFTSTLAFPYSLFQGFVPQPGATNAPTATPALVTVRNTADHSIAVIYSDNAGTKKSNPFSADKNGYWSFYADDGLSVSTCGAASCGTYDVSFGGSGASPGMSLSSLTSVGPASLPRFISDAGYTSLSTACAAAAAAKLQLILTRPWDLNGACAANVYAYRGGIIRPAAGHTATLTGSFDGDQSQHFDVSLGGKITAAKGFSVSDIYASWFGVANDGKPTASTLQSAYDAVGALNGNRLVLSSGSYLIERTILVPNGVQTVCGGASYPQQATVFRAGADAFAMFRTRFSNRDNSWEHCSFNGNAHHSVTELFLDGCIGCRVLDSSFINFDATSTALKGGGNLLTEIGQNTFAGAGTAMDFVNDYSSSAEKTYYGIGVGNIHDNAISAGGGSRIGGNSIKWTHNDVEMKVNANSGAGTGSAVLFCDPRKPISIEMDGYNYFELTQGTAAPMRAIGVCSGSFSVTDAQIYGEANTGDAISVTKPDGSDQTYTYNLRITGVSFARWNNGINLGTGFTNSLTPDSVISNNAWNRVAHPIVGINNQNRSVQTVNATSPGATFMITDPEYGHVVKGAIVESSAVATGASTVIDISSCNICILDSKAGPPRTYTGVTHSLGPGNRFIVFGDGKDVLSNSGFHPAANRDIVIPAGVGVMFAIGPNGIAEIGNRSMDIPTPFERLGACDAAHEGNHTPIPDSNVETFNSPITASGPHHGMAWCDGSKWTFR